MRILHSMLFLLFAFTVNPVHSQSVPFINDQTTGCSGAVRQTSLGSMGGAGIVAADIDNDGKTEIICSASEDFYMAREYFWYVLSFNPASASYEPIYVSGLYGNDNITALAVFDVDSDGEPEILIGKGSGKIEIFDGATRQLERAIPTIQSPGLFSKIYKLLLADADNDGRNELLAGCYEYTLIYECDNIGEYSLGMTLPYSGQDISCGNVDAEPLLETIFSSGEVIRIENNNSNYLWRIPTHDIFGCVELADVDGDGILEILYDGWYLGVYDGDTQQLKYEVYAGSSPNTFLMSDVNGDGLEEILYANYYDVTCLNSSNGEEYWSIPNIDYYIKAMTIGDLDSDSDIEICWVSIAHNSIHVYDVSTQEREWKSTDVRGPFTSVRIADSDDDGQPELLTLSYESNEGYSGGILTVFDATTGALEWQSSPTFFYNSFLGLHDIEITDIDNDGNNEIIVSGSAYRDGVIYIIDGKTHVIKKTFRSSEYLNGFYGFTIGDPDNDGERDFIASTQTNIFVINSSSGNVVWKSPDYEPLSDPVQKIVCANPDNDYDNDIIFLNGSISIIDGVSHSIRTIPEEGFSSLDIYDMNNDGLPDIIAGSVTGKIGVYYAPDFELSWLPIQMNGRISDLYIAEIHGDARPDIVFVSGGIVWFSTPEGDMQGTARIGVIDQLYDCLELSDYNNDGQTEVFAGTSSRVTELNSQCYQCMSIAVEITGTDISCGISDGIATAIASGGVEPYTFQWSNGGIDFTQQNLTAGTYEVIVTDQLDCTISAEITLEQSVLTAIIASSPVGCSDEYPAKVRTEIKKGHPPYTWEWNTGHAGPQFETFQPGTYEVMIRDNMNCSKQLSVFVYKDTIILETIKRKITCNGPGSITTEVMGFPPYLFEWSDGSNSPYISCPEPGDFTITVTDSLQCLGTATITINPLIPVGGEFSVEPDNFDTAEPEGVIAFKPVGGDPPYRIYWHNIWNNYNDTLLVNVPGGIYSLTVMDSNDCSAELTVEVEKTSFDKPSRVFPVPAASELFIDLGVDFVPSINSTAEILTILGQHCNTYVLTRATNSISIDHLRAGYYLLKLNVNGELKVFRFEKVTP